MPCFSDYALTPLARFFYLGKIIYFGLAIFFAIFQCFLCLRCFRCLRCFFGFELFNFIDFAKATHLFGFKSVFPASANAEPPINKLKIKLPIIPTLFLICLTPSLYSFLRFAERIKSQTAHGL